MATVADEKDKGPSPLLLRLRNGGVFQDAERLHQFRQEFRRMSDMSHPNLVGMQTLEVDGIQWFFTMDLVRGTDFYSYVRPQGQLDETRLRATLPQLVSGVMALHGQQIVHRDLKPGNVMIRDDGQVVVLDFGLVAELQERADVTEVPRFAGTPAYAAPEQFFESLTAAGDWYAMGTMLYQALSLSPGSTFGRSSPRRRSCRRMCRYSASDSKRLFIARAVPCSCRAGPTGF